MGEGGQKNIEKCDLTFERKYISFIKIRSRPYGVYRLTDVY